MAAAAPAAAAAVADKHPMAASLASAISVAKVEELAAVQRPFKRPQWRPVAPMDAGDGCGGGGSGGDGEVNRGGGDGCRATAKVRWRDSSSEVSASPPTAPTVTTSCSSGDHVRPAGRRPCPRSLGQTAPLRNTCDQPSVGAAYRLQGRCPRAFFCIKATGHFQCFQLAESSDIGCAPAEMCNFRQCILLHSPYPLAA